MLKKKPKELTPEQIEEIRTKDFFDMILPGTVKFLSDHYVVGDSYRCVWVIREYPPTTEEQAILSQLGDRSGVTLRIYHRLVESMEQRKIIQNATRRNKLKSGGNDVNETIEAEGNLQDVVELLANLRKNKEPLLHCSVFLELKAKNMDALKELQSEISMELTRSKISVDRLTLRQKEGFLSVLPVGANQFGAQYERVLPASSVANLYPFNFSGKTDPQGIYIGRDKFGTNILVDFDRRAEDKTTSNILILGNSGQGKSYLLKLILTNIRESGKSIICLDPESEYEEICSALGGCYIDFMSGEYTINPLEPKSFGVGGDDGDDTACPAAFKKVTRLSQHIAFLKDFFRSYKDFSDTQIDTIEILLSKLYARFGITDSTDYSKMKPTDYPVMEDFYNLCEEEFMSYDSKRKYLYTEETLQEVCLSIHSMCIGAESKYFNGDINIDTDRLQTMVVQNLSAEEKAKLQFVEDMMNTIDDKMTAAGFNGRVKEAQVLYVLALSDFSHDSGFADKLVTCFQENQTDEQLISAVNSAFGTQLTAEDFSNVMGNIRSLHIDTSDYTDPSTKNNIDLAKWAIHAQESGWGYVYGTYGAVLDKSVFEFKKNQYPDEVGGYVDFIEQNWLGRRTADCVGLIKGYGWYNAESGKINIGANGMQDVSANGMFQVATEKGTIDTIPEIPGLAVWHEGHIGIYIGNSEVIQAANTKAGVIRTPLNQSGWTHWLKIPYISYVDEKES